MEGIGKLIVGDAQRDAIHVAIAPVVAAADLLPGRHVGIDVDGKASTAEPHLGIVDPFLGVGPKAGERFYLFLYPNTVTSLRHEWTHPAFAASKASGEQSTDKQFSEQWLRVYAAKMNCYEGQDKAFQTLIEGLRSGELFAHGSDLHGLFDVDDECELKQHAERYLGITIDWNRFSFSCSC